MRHVFSVGVVVLLSAGSGLMASGKEIDLRDYALLREGMSEAEVYYRLGPCDYESVYSDYHHVVIRRVCSYLPDPQTSTGWITEITFDSRGRVQKLDRFRP